MPNRLDPGDRRLLDEWQRDFPLVPRPFAVIGGALGLSEERVLERLGRLLKAGSITRVGATLRPNTAGASTLAALAAPEERFEAVAATVSAEAGVNHSYMREHDWNLWFVVTGPDRPHVDATLARIGHATALCVLDLPLVRPFNIDLGFPLTRQAVMPAARTVVDRSAIKPQDRPLLQALTEGLALVPRPFAALAAEQGVSESCVIARIRCLAAAGVLSRIGIIVRHRALGWTSNAMVVWQVEPAQIDRAGPLLAAEPGVTLCYERRPAPPAWPYTLYAMIHARSRNEALEVLIRAERAAGLDGVPREILFSLRCFKQRGALVAATGPDEAKEVRA